MYISCSEVDRARDSLAIDKLLAIESTEYKTLKDRRKFYGEADRLFTRYGYEVRWFKVAEETVRILEIAHGRVGGFFAKSNDEIRLFFNEGNKAILDDILIKIRLLWDEHKLLKGTEALQWDAQVLSDEQDLIDPFYEKMSKNSQQILDNNLKRWASEKVFGNPRFDGDVLNQADRWEFGMIKMGYCVSSDMMPDPNKDWRKVKLVIQSINRKGMMIIEKEP